MQAPNTLSWCGIRFLLGMPHYHFLSTRIPQTFCPSNTCSTSMLQLDTLILLTLILFIVEKITSQSADFTDLEKPVPKGSQNRGELNQMRQEWMIKWKANRFSSLISSTAYMGIFFANGRQSHERCATFFITSLFYWKYLLGRANPAQILSLLQIVTLLFVRVCLQ